MTPEQRAAHRRRNAKYSASPKGIAAHRRHQAKHNRSEKGLATRARHKKTRLFAATRTAYKASVAGKAAELRYQLKRYHRITEIEYRRMLLAQNGLCALCVNANFKGRRLYVDHNHITGKIRGLLCHSCNVALGLFKENVEVLRLAALYLEQHARENDNILEGI